MYDKVDVVKFSEFKVGQYVVAKDGYRFKGPKPILDIKRENIWENYPDTDPYYIYSYRTENHWTCERDLELWQPLIGDYNFFYNKKTSLGRVVIPTFGRFEGFDEDGWYKVIVSDFEAPEIFKNCVPYTGEVFEWLR